MAGKVSPHVSRLRWKCRHPYGPDPRRGDQRPAGPRSGYPGRSQPHRLARAQEHPPLHRALARGHGRRQGHFRPRHRRRAHPRALRRRERACGRPAHRGEHPERWCPAQVRLHRELEAALGRPGVQPPERSSEGRRAVSPGAQRPQSDVRHLAQRRGDRGCPSGYHRRQRRLRCHHGGAGEALTGEQRQRR